MIVGLGKRRRDGFILKETELTLIYFNPHDCMNANIGFLLETEEHTFQRLSEKGTLVLFVLFALNIKGKQNDRTLEKNHS